jgi:hypothetical protein
VRRRGGIAFGLAVCVIASLFSCRQIVGIEDSPPEDIQTTVSGLQFGTGACAACAQESCAAMSTFCSMTPPCKAYEDCLGACKGDPKCRSQCTVDNRVGGDSTGEISALSVCLASNCEADCNLSCGGVAAYVTPPASAVDCEACLAPDCDVENACARSVDCDAYVRCLLACPTFDCQQACATTHADGFMRYGQFDGARFSNCATRCAYGNDWSCVGHSSAPAPKSANTAITFQGIYDQATVETGMTPIPGVQVTICGSVGNGTDFSCNPALVPPTPTNATNASGDVTIPAVPIAMSLDGTGLMGYGLLRAMGYMDTWFFWGYPLSEPSVTWGKPFSPSLFLDKLPPSPQVGTGSAWVVAFDCLGLLAGGVHVKTGDSDMEPDYFHYPPDDAGTYANVPNSGSPGIAKYESLPVGAYKFQAFPEGATQPSSVVIANVFENAQSLVALFPNQSGP